MSEENGEGIGREEFVVCTGRICTSDCPKFPQFPVQWTYSFHLLQHSPKPDLVSLKTPSVCPAEMSEKALATQFETAYPINSNI